MALPAPIPLKPERRLRVGDIIDTNIEVEVTSGVDAKANVVVEPARVLLPISIVKILRRTPLHRVEVLVRVQVHRAQVTQLITKGDRTTLK
jgi:hypothetical protein